MSSQSQGGIKLELSFGRQKHRNSTSDNPGSNPHSAPYLLCDLDRETSYLLGFEIHNLRKRGRKKESFTCEMVVKFTGVNG